MGKPTPKLPDDGVILKLSHSASLQTSQCSCAGVAESASFFCFAVWWAIFSQNFHVSAVFTVENCWFLWAGTWMHCVHTNEKIKASRSSKSFGQEWKKKILPVDWTLIWSAVVDSFKSATYSAWSKWQTSSICVLLHSRVKISCTIAYCAIHHECMHVTDVLTHSCMGPRLRSFRWILGLCNVGKRWLELDVEKVCMHDGENGSWGFWKLQILAHIRLIWKSCIQNYWIIYKNSKYTSCIWNLEYFHTSTYSYLERRKTH